MTHINFMIVVKKQRDWVVSLLWQSKVLCIGFPYRTF